MRLCIRMPRTCAFCSTIGRRCAQRTGVGEYVHRDGAGALAAAPPGRRADALLELMEGPAARPRSRARDRRARDPGAGRSTWPGTGSDGRRSSGSPAAVDIVHSPHPLLMPARRPRRSSRSTTSTSSIIPSEPRGDPPRLRGARRPPRPPRRSRGRRSPVHGAARSSARLGVPARSHRPSARRARPAWTPRRGAAPRTARSCSSARSNRARTSAPCSTPTTLLARGCRRRRSLIAGGAPPSPAPLARRDSHSRRSGPRAHLGYVDERRARRRFYRARRCWCCRRFDEGFGLPVLEAMTAGVRSSPRTAARCPRWRATPAARRPDDAAEHGRALAADR